MNSNLLKELINRYHLGIASEDEVAELDAALLEDSQSRDIFIAATRLETNLYDEAANAIPADESFHSIYPPPFHTLPPFSTLFHASPHLAAEPARFFHSFYPPLFHISPKIRRHHCEMH